VTPVAQLVTTRRRVKHVLGSTGSLDWWIVNKLQNSFKNGCTQTQRKTKQARSNQVLHQYPGLKRQVRPTIILVHKYGLYTMSLARQLETETCIG